MEIRITVPRPLALLTTILIVSLFLFGVLKVQLPWKGDSTSIGGVAENEERVNAHRTIERESVKRAVLERQEEILRYQFSELEKTIGETTDPALSKELGDARARLLAIIRERSAAEEMIGRSLLLLWEAEGTRYRTGDVEVGELLAWPVAPTLGISAGFLDEGYEERFGLKHFAIDIPVEQGTTIRAAAAGTVSHVSMNGFGYSFLTIKHTNGLETLYGHISQALVGEGDIVSIGQAIAESGGTPGTEGAGLLTTGPHLHFSVRVDGALVDPLPFLPKVRSVES